MTHQMLERLMQQIHQRVSEMPEGSYTTQLLRGGVPRMGAKVMEEAAEVVEAAGEPGEEGRQHTIREACDLLFHLFVLVASREISLEDLQKELGRREGISGLQEKASRPKKT
jgi:phosphoribosyl-ATP pyrophosphohydrolase